jgi:hypothetical protein
LDPQCNSRLCGSPSWLNHRGFAVFWMPPRAFEDVGSSPFLICWKRSRRLLTAWSLALPVTRTT